MSYQYDLYIALTILILLPIVPAYLLFKALPGRADVSGLFQGLELKLGGAFAGYFALVFLLLFQLPRINEVVNPKKAQVWTVEGYLGDDHGNGLDIAPNDIQFVPPALEQDHHGSFSITFATKLNPYNGNPEMPQLSLGHSTGATINYLNETVRLDESLDIEKKDDQVHHIKLKRINLKKTPPPSDYHPNVGLPPLVIDPAGQPKGTTGTQP